MMTEVITGRGDAMIILHMRGADAHSFLIHFRARGLVFGEARWLSRDHKGSNPWRSGEASETVAITHQASMTSTHRR